MKHSVQFDAELIQRYDTAGPRYTSYPTAVEFHEGFSEQDYKTQIALSNQRGGPLSLYFHLPFCDTVCFYCACNKIITKNRRHAQPYLDNLHQEIAMQAALFDSDRVVEQLHWGGGTPTFISHQQMRDLMLVTRDHFKLADDEQGEFSIEVDPREADAETIALLREIGFNRLSLGLQDFNPAVQKAVNRIQSEKETFAVLDAARANGFRSISLDLIYGLPHQTVDSFSETLDKVIAVSPDRLSVFNYAHLPGLFKTQRQIDDDTLPSPQVKLDILQRSIEKLTQAGYVYIGMDHFAKPDDELALAQQQHKLYRNFQGYSTHAECDLIGLGITSIGSVGDSYAQNVKTLGEYDQHIKQGQLPGYRGIELNEDDKIRRSVINRLICDFALDIAAVEKQHNIDFADYFHDVFAQLEQFAHDGLLQYNGEHIEVLPAGRLLIRNICMAFDRYSQQKKRERFSKVI
ncbi:oxygen-independent coproporphyrinogen III oxidase [Methylophaga sp. OBS4]|uniref:oxygen-independent coproporphyrinogen III oxidase n=1 Tax=Methylophaga sp. OBS4 TaxID=2991935 RepID=UPI00225B4AD6|nr:oxygen-independent coproporphyrinogen III oxidase [Methylophaga sp. OBS4]MCX4187021.1 oxygen-independent coproporphyrinogen III oxidase [Methylophaga sp. OBS4]